MRWALGAGGATLAIAGARRARHLAAVAPDLRTPTLLLPMTMSTPTMWIFRGLQALAPAPTVPAGLRVTEHWIPQEADGPAVRVVSFERCVTSKPRAAMLWVHGGGFVCGRPEQDMALMAQMLERLDVLIVSVDYRLAPEHPFPAPLDDAYAVLAWLAAHAADLAIDPDRIAVGGQSAGGGLAAALVQRTVDHGPVRPIFQLLVYPMLDVATTRRREHDGRGRFVWTPGSNRFGWRSYLGQEPTGMGHAAYAVPAARADLGDMPPTWIGVGTLDLFHDEDVSYGHRLADAGVACDIDVVEGAYHGFDLLRPDAITSRRFQDAMVASLEQALARAQRRERLVGQGASPWDQGDRR